MSPEGKRLCPIYRTLHMCSGMHLALRRCLIASSAQLAPFIMYRFACKEAVFKALSSIDRARWQDFSIIAGGYQEGLLSGSAGRENRRHLRVLWEKSTPLTCIIEAEDIDVQVSISHDGEYATGIAIAAKR